MVAELGSLAKAAQALEIAQSALSRQIALLEQECGGRLLHRTGRGMVLTRMGESALPKAQALLEFADRLSMELRDASHIPSGLVRVGMLHSAARPLASALFEYLQHHAPEVRLHVLEAFTGQLDEYRNTGKIDVAVVNRYRRADPQEEVLGSFDMYLVGSAKASLTAVPTIEFSKLHDIPLVLPGAPSELRVRLEQHARKHGIRLRIVLEAETLTTMKDVVSRSGAYTVLPSYAVAPEVSSKLLTISRIVKPTLRRYMCLGITSARPISLAAKEVASAVSMIARTFASDGTWPRSF